MRWGTVISDTMCSGDHQTWTNQVYYYIKFLYCFTQILYLLLPLLNLACFSYTLFMEGSNALQYVLVVCISGTQFFFIFARIICICSSLNITYKVVNLFFFMTNSFQSQYSSSSLFSVIWLDKLYLVVKGMHC